MDRRSSCVLLQMVATLVVLAGNAAAQTKPQAAPSRQPARTAQREPANQPNPDGQAPPATRPRAQQAPQQTQQQPAAGLREPQDPNGTAPRARGTAGASAKAPAAKVLVPQAPFTLTDSQQKLLDAILDKWEKKSAKVDRFKCTFTRWDYDPAFGRPEDKLKGEAKGVIKYKSPDCGDYSVESLQEYDAAKNALKPKTEGLDHWVCDGKSIYEFLPEKKQLVVRELPPALQGKAIVDGPLPFIFGAKADQLRERYWMHDITPKQFIGKEVWLEAAPKRQQDAANFQRATIILTDPEFVPFALQILLPDGKNTTAYKFEDQKVNDPLWIIKRDFVAPMTPPFWKKVVEKADDQPVAPAASSPPAGEASQATRPAPKRK